MSDSRNKCIVENHDAHDLPRLFVLREPGRLWFFDICNPHVWPGSHWGVPDEIMRGDSGSWVCEMMTGDARSVAATGRNMREIRSAIVAQLAFSLRAGDEAPRVCVVVRRPRFFEGDAIVPDLEWEPSLPPEFHIESIGDENRLDVESRGALENLVNYLSDFEDFSISIDRIGSIEFPHESERFYLLHDAPQVGFAVDEIARRLNLEVIPNTCPLSEHASSLAGT